MSYRAEPGRTNTPARIIVRVVADLVDNPPLAVDVVPCTFYPVAGRIEDRHEMSADVDLCQVPIEVASVIDALRMAVLHADKLPGLVLPGTRFLGDFESQDLLAGRVDEEGSLADLHPRVSLEEIFGRIELEGDHLAAELVNVAPFAAAQSPWSTHAAP